MRTVLVSSLTVLLVACASHPSSRSAYPSGWSLDTSLEKQRQCGVVRHAPGQFSEDNLALLVSKKYLTESQAARAKALDVRAGDPECLAYAAYGLQQARVIEQFGNHRLTGITVSFACNNSNVPCPGMQVQVVDGFIQSVGPMPKVP